MSAPIYGPPPVTHWDFDYDQVDYWSDPNYSPPFPDYVMQYWDPMNYTPPRPQFEARDRRDLAEQWEAAGEELRAHRAAAAPPETPSPPLQAQPQSIVERIDVYRQEHDCSITVACEALYQDLECQSASALSQAYYRAKRQR